MAHPWLSVVMPTFNGAGYLRQALASVLAERDDSVEILVVDDGSTDGTPDVARAFADRLPLSLICRLHTGDWVSGTNIGIGLAQGEYVCFLHQDDYWLPGRLAALRRASERNSEATLFLHPVWYVDCRSRRLGLWRCPLPTHGRPLPPQLVVERLLVQSFIAAPAPLFRREAATQVGGLDARLWYTADWDFWLALAANSPTVYLPRPLAAFRLHPQAQTVQRSGDRTLRDQLLAVLLKHTAPLARRGLLSGSAVKAARFSAEVNTGLADALHGRLPPLARLAVSFLLLGPDGWRRYFRDSRIVERVSARIAARLWE
jgi:glycosyltransferase involved in cell wall biosynthesis